jgi:hypothetical protein
MGKIKGPKVHALTVHDGSSNKNKKCKEKDKRKKMQLQIRKSIQNPSMMNLDPKVERGEMHLLP